MRFAAAALLAAFISTPAAGQDDKARLAANCARQAAHDSDPQKPASIRGRLDETINPQAALNACLAAAKALPEDGLVLFHFGRALQASKQDDKARAAYEIADRLGHPVAPASLAFLLARERGGAKDLARARKLYEKSAEAGVPGAMRALALMYARGQGGSKDEEKARHWLHQARSNADKLAANGNTQAMMLLALMDQNGEAGRKDEGLARNWRERAAAAGHGVAAFTLGSQAAEHQDFAAAREWYTKAAGVNHYRAMVRLGSLYEKGQGGPREIAVAESWFAKAAEGGDTVGAKELERLRKAKH